MRRLSFIAAVLAVAVSSSAFATDCQVLNSDDSGAGSLRDCIDNVAVDPGDRITFDASVTAPIALTSGEILISQSIVIEGLGEGVTVIDGAGNGGERILHVDSFDIFVDVSGVTLRNADTTGSGGEGAGLFVDTGFVSLSDSSVTGNRSPAGGGGIFVRFVGALSLDNVKVTDNRALASPGGGGIYNEGILFMRDSEVSGNSVAAAAGFDDVGGGIYTDGQTEIFTSLIQGNTADDDGGGVYNDEGDLVIVSSRIEGNTSINERGGGVVSSGQLTLRSSEIVGNAAPSGTAGGIDVQNGFALIEDVRIEGNTSGASAGLSTQAGMILRRSVISGNTASNAGGGAGGGMDLSSGEILIEDCLVADNKALGGPNSEGGGISNSGAAPVFITNTTIVGNETDGDGGGLLVRGETVLNNVTIVGNAAGEDGGGLINQEQMLFRNSIIAGNSAGVAGPDCIDESAGMISGGPNLIQDLADCAFSGPEAIVGDPLVGPLAANGGSTRTLALLAGSPALDAGDDVHCASADQRGTARPQGAACDLGAFEAGPAADLSSAQLVFGPEEIGSSSPVQNVTLTNAGSVDLTVKAIVISGADVGDFTQTNDCGVAVAAGDSCGLSFTFTPAAAGVRQATVTLDTSAGARTIALLGAGAEVVDGGDADGDTDNGGGCGLVR